MKKASQTFVSVPAAKIRHVPVVNLLVFDVPTMLNCSGSINSQVFGTQHSMHCKLSTSKKPGRTPCHGDISWHLVIHSLAQNHSSMLTGTVKCTAKDEDSRVENWVSGQMLSTGSTVERIYKFCEKHIIISVASKYYEIVTPRKHILFLQLHVWLLVGLAFFF